VKVLLFTHSEKGSGKATILSNVVLGLIVNGKRVCVVNIDEDVKIIKYLGLEKQGKKLVYSYVSEGIVANLLEIGENRPEQLMQWFGMYYPKFDMMLITCSQENEAWVRRELGIVLDLQEVIVTNSALEGQRALKRFELIEKKPIVVINSAQRCESSEFLQFPRLKEIEEGTQEGKPYIYFNGEDEKADVIWDFFDKFVEKI